MELSLRVGAALIGLLVIVAFLRSVLQVAIVNRQRGDWLARRVGWLVYTILARWALKRQSYAHPGCAGMGFTAIHPVADRRVVWLGASWLFIANLVVPSRAQLLASGDRQRLGAQLGFLTPPGIAGQLLAILEGAMGLGIVVFYFTFIPGYQTTIQLRQVKVAWLYARAGPGGLTNFTLVEWYLLSGASDWSELWEDWESWFRNLAETHALAPILAFVPTVQRGQTWLGAAAVALDSVSFYLSALEARGMPSATVCHRTGVDALGLIAAEMADRLAAAPAALDCRRLGRSDFDTACDRAAALGAAVKAERDACWLRFAELRGEYEAFLSSLQSAGAGA